MIGSIFHWGNPEDKDLRAAYSRRRCRRHTESARACALRGQAQISVSLRSLITLLSGALPPQALAGFGRRAAHGLSVSSDNALQELWETRKSLFFKPAGGYGSNAVYRGDKVTKGVWAEIIRGGYVAQNFAAPSERMVKLDGSPASRKTDVRSFVSRL